MIAPSTPVSVPNLRGRRKTPDPIIDPTTIAVSVGQTDLLVGGPPWKWLCLSS